jgi:hypothetical protein
VSIVNKVEISLAARELRYYMTRINEELKTLGHAQLGRAWAGSASSIPSINSHIVPAGRLSDSEYPLAIARFATPSHHHTSLCTIEEVILDKSYKP